MGKLTSAKMIGLRDRATKEIIAVYPEVAEGTDEEIIKIVRDRYYQQSCAAEDRLLTAYVDVLTDNEIKAQNN
jgi:hypothetical protein